MKQLHTGLCDLLDIRYPVLRAGMGIITPYSLTATSPELVAAVSNKDLILQADDEGTAKSEYWTGKLMRHFRTPVGAAWETPGLKPLPMPLQGILMWDIVAGALEQGKYEHSGQLIGQGIGMIKEIKPARQVVEELVAQAVQALAVAGKWGASQMDSSRR